MKLLFIVSIFLLQTFAFSQHIEGIIITKNNIPIFNAQILNVNSNLHTHSNEKGKFLLKNISLGDKINISHIGYYDTSIIIKSLTEPVSVILKEKKILLQGAVILPKINALQIFSDIDIKTITLNSSQDILKQVPGLFIGQHAGGGKSEQIFLRGFDADHGTDVSISIDGIPVNIVSHAHGQGYSDLHFIIPETIEKIGFGKGAYYTNRGNFNTAGYIDFETKSQLENSSIKLEVGQFNTNRLLGMFNILSKTNHNAYISIDNMSSDSFFDASQNFNRLNLFGKYMGQISTSEKIKIILSHFTSKWDASGQIPQRAVNSGLISRFGAIDDTEGGQTNRSNMIIHYDKVINKNSSLKNQIYYSAYDFRLFSNFTFFLEDPINGDQIMQKENRKLIGLKSQYKHNFSSANFSGNWNIGISLRRDKTTGSELSHTLNRKKTLSQIRLGDIDEQNIAGFMSGNVNVKHWTFNAGIRADSFHFQYIDALLEKYRPQVVSEVIFSPKLNILYSYSDNLQFYLKNGKGFHSNDTRVVVNRRDKKTLPSSYGSDLGFIWKPIPRIIINIAYWYLFLEQEFVYVGDAGIIEPSGETQRQGFDLGIRYQFWDWLFWKLDANYTFSRTVAENEYIPLAPNFTLVSGFNFKLKSGIYGGLNLKHINDRPANEDNSIVAKGYSIVDLNLGYSWKKISLQLQVQNLFNSEWKETQFATESRLRNEDSPVNEIHFTPGTPFFIKTAISYNF